MYLSGKSILVAFASLFFATNVFSAKNYTITDLGSLGGGDTIAFGLNDQGQVVGQSNGHAFFWQNGVMADLGTFGGSSSFAYDLNNSGSMVGRAQDSSGYYKAFLWNITNGMINLGTLGGNESKASSINDAGQIVGSADDNSTDSHHTAYWDSSLQIYDLGTLGGDEGFAERINEVGQAVGRSRASDGISYAFIWDSVNGLQTLDPVSETNGYAAGINDLGQVVGVQAPSWDVYLWDSVNGLQDLSILGTGWSYTYNINNAGEIIGARQFDDTQTSAFIYDLNTNLLSDLMELIPDDSGWDSLDTARDINEAGQIVGQGTIDGETHAFLLTPVASIPEPSVIFLFLFGLGYIFRVVKKLQ